MEWIADDIAACPHGAASSRGGKAPRTAIWTGPCDGPRGPCLPVTPVHAAPGQA
ncbi:uncharacterized protein AruCF_5054 [Achromobacter ruhlandii]|nr:uncharacterized protein AruCF_5054 [Achromobacter ruhlandii]